MNKVLDSMNAHYNGKLREAEASMGQMFIAFRQANDAGVDPAVIKQAQDLHSVAHTNWEWWTASNGSWFHNMPQAKESLANPWPPLRKQQNFSATQLLLKLLHKLSPRLSRPPRSNLI